MKIPENHDSMIIAKVVNEVIENTIPILSTNGNLVSSGRELPDATLDATHHVLTIAL